MDNWDDEDFEPANPISHELSDKWEGEDEVAPLKDNWDDDEEEEKPAKPKKAAEKEQPKTEIKRHGKKYLQQKLKEKEAQEQKAAEERRLKEENKTPEEKMADRLLAQKLAEESELEIVKGQFNTEDFDPGKVTIDVFKPRTKEDFTRFAKMLTDKLSTLEDSPHYYYLLDTVINSAIVKLDAESLRKLTLPINALANEKLKLEKEKHKKGKKSQKAKVGGSVKATRNDALDDFSQYDDFDDFM